LEKVKKYLSNCLCALLGAVLASGAIHAQSDQANLVHFGDLLEVDVIGSYEYDWRGTLTPDGYLDGLDTIENQIYGLCQTRMLFRQPSKKNSRRRSAIRRWRCEYSIGRTVLSHI
jgi:hypothetical protein